MKSPFKSLLLLVEASDADMRAAELALEMAASLDTGLVAVAVVEVDTLTQLLRSRILVEDEMDQLRVEMESEGQRRMDYIAAQARARKVKLEPALVKGSLSGAVLDQQQQHGSDLVVMGGFTYTMLKRDINLRQKQLVIDQCPCPVLLVK